MRSSPEELIAEAEQEVLAEYARTAQCLDSVGGLLLNATRFSAKALVLDSSQQQHVRISLVDLPVRVDCLLVRI